jgi:hypothetical protein
MRIFRIASKKFHYLGQCNKVRCNPIGENNWQKMIQNHVKVSQEEFESNCDLEELLDEDEPLEEFIGSDPTSYFAKSLWGNKPCYYIMTAGFEFIFIE